MLFDPRIIIFIILLTLAESVIGEVEISEKILFELGRNCGSRDIRGNPNKLKLLENCRSILGNLRISDMPKATGEQIERFSFPDLANIKGYLLIDNVGGLKTLSQLFPNLTTIKGTETFRGFSLLIRNNRELHEIITSRPMTVETGIVKLVGNPNLCLDDKGRRDKPKRQLSVSLFYFRDELLTKD